MRILLDHNVPAPLRHIIVDHQVSTAYEEGWAELTNGELLRMAEDAGFDALITTDQSVRYQQNLTGRRLAIIVIGTNDWTRIRGSQSRVLDAISNVIPGCFIELAIPSR
jgi:hypothetical protein